MAITETHFRPNSPGVERVEVTHEGRVVEVRTYVARRNHSDTLDYSDWRDTQVTEALVWVGRWATKYDFLPVSDTNPLEPVPVDKRFKWVDCSNIFVWRGVPHRGAQVDFIAFAIPELMEDLEARLKIQEENARAAEAKRIADEAWAQKARDEEERNRPVVGKQMVVVKGRKVPKGTRGTVAFIHSNGGVLLKSDDSWRDRTAPGTWIDAGNLAAR